jgi:cold shock CspA family protein
MASKPTKIGTVTFYNSDSGAFIQDLSESEPIQKQQRKGFSPASQVFVPAELIKDLGIEEGQLVEFEEENNVALNVTPLARK